MYSDLNSCYITNNLNNEDLGVHVPKTGGPQNTVTPAVRPATADPETDVHEKVTEITTMWGSLRLAPIIGIRLLNLNK